MLPKQNRVPIGEFPSGTRTLLRGNKIVARVVPNTTGLIRVGVLSKHKNVGGSVSRNAVKRYVLNYLRPIVSEKRDVGLDLLIIIAAPIIRLDPQTKKELARDLTEVGTMLSGGVE